MATTTAATNQLLLKTLFTIPPTFLTKSLSFTKPTSKLTLSSSSLSLSCTPFSLHKPSFIAHNSEYEGASAVLDGEEGDAATSSWADEGSEGGEGGEFSEPPEGAKLFVGNLHFEVDSEKLAHLFEDAGVVEIAEIIYNRETQRSRGFGFVTMSTIEEADKAVELFNNYELNGRMLTVNKAAPKGARPERPPRVFEAANRIYVGNLPWDVDNSRLEQVFSEHGKVLSARVVFDRETGRSRGFGFVAMESEAEMNDAIAALDGQTLEGRSIRVNVAQDRQSRGF